MGKRVLSGIRATGRLHLGNYLGAIKGMLELQDNPDYETFYMVADVHTITTPYNVSELKQNIKEVVLDYLAAGIDPEKSELFIQSEVPQQLELSHYLSSVISIARMQHLPTFKDKVAQHPNNVTMALLNYPILMAADILAYKATDVPVGVDQEPHLEVTRQIARKMNDTYKTNLPEPKIFETKGKYIPSLTGEGKMSKSSEGSFINLTDDLETIQDKLAKAPTDSGKGGSVPEKGSIAGLLHFVELFEGEKKKKEYEEQYVGDGIRYADLKKNLAAAIFETLKPIQEKRSKLEKDPEYIEAVLKKSSERARKVAQETLDEVKEKMGF